MRLNRTKVELKRRDRNARDRDFQRFESNQSGIETNPGSVPSSRGRQFESNQSGIETQNWYLFGLTLAVRLNRTKVELKRGLADMRTVSTCGLNRTKVELKPHGEKQNNQSQQSFESNQSGIETQVTRSQCNS